MLQLRLAARGARRGREGAGGRVGGGSRGRRARGRRAEQPQGNRLVWRAATQPPPPPGSHLQSAALRLDSSSAVASRSPRVNFSASVNSWTASSHCGSPGRGAGGVGFGGGGDETKEVSGREQRGVLRRRRRRRRRRAPAPHLALREQRVAGAAVLCHHPLELRADVCLLWGVEGDAALSGTARLMGPCSPDGRRGDWRLAAQPDAGGEGAARRCGRVGVSPGAAGANAPPRPRAPPRPTRRPAPRAAPPARACAQCAPACSRGGAVRQPRDPSRPLPSRLTPRSLSAPSDASSTGSSPRELSMGASAPAPSLALIAAGAARPQALSLLAGRAARGVGAGVCGALLRLRGRPSSDNTATVPALTRKTPPARRARPPAFPPSPRPAAGHAPSPRPMLSACVRRRRWRAHEHGERKGAAVTGLSGVW
jgi:hypothetical protein